MMTEVVEISSVTPTWIPVNCTDNCTMDNSTIGNRTGPEGPNMTGYTALFASFYTLICAAGLLGNGLVIFVVLKYTKMKTVTNIYILNLAISDLCFLVGLPILIVTSITKAWVFGYHMCKIFHTITSINWFTSVFTLTVMSADRYLAVCHPVRSMSYRTPLVSRVVCICVWVASMLVMLPIMLYARTLPRPDGKVSCTIAWPEGQAINPDKAFIWYTLLLGFAIPSALISVFYTLVVMRLRTVGPRTKSKEKKKSHRRVTKMVLTVIAVYIICWLPYWIFQVVLTFKDPKDDPKIWVILVFQMITVLGYCNSMLNPLLYAFFSENFRKTFIKAFKCASSAEVNGALQVEHSMYPGGRKSAGTLTGQGNSTKTKMTNTETLATDCNNTSDVKQDGEQPPTELKPVSPSALTISANHKDTEGLEAKPTPV